MSYSTRCRCGRAPRCGYRISYSTRPPFRAAGVSRSRGRALTACKHPAQVSLYEDLIKAGDRDAIWRFYAFENNLIEEDPAKLLDPYRMAEEEYAEAQSVSFFCSSTSGLSFLVAECSAFRLLRAAAAYLRLDFMKFYLLS